MKKHLLLSLMLLAVLCTTNLASYVSGSTSYDCGRLYNTADALRNERKLANALFEMLHSYYEFNDVEYDNNDSVIARHNFWYDCIMETDAYATADSVLEGDWEDFYEDWKEM